MTEKALAEFLSLYNRREMAAYQLVGAVRTVLAFFEAQQFDQAEAAVRRAYQDYQDADQRVTEFFNSRKENQLA